jgi:hypothetical protein
MAKSKVVIVYSPYQARRRAVIVPDANDPPDWDEVHVPAHIARETAPGERAVTIPIGLYHLIGPDAALQQILGRPPQSSRHAVVDPGGKVVSFIHVDSAIFPVVFRDGHTIKPDPNGRAKVGDLVHRMIL